MVAHTRRALDLAIQFRKAIALDMVTVSAQESYDLLKAVVRAGLKASQDGNVVTRQQIDAAKALLHMAGLSEPQIERTDKDHARMSLAELEAMITELKVVSPDGQVARNDEQPIDIFS